MLQTNTATTTKRFIGFIVNTLNRRTLSPTLSPSISAKFIHMNSGENYSIHISPILHYIKSHSFYPSSNAFNSWIVAFQFVFSFARWSIVSFEWNFLGKLCVCDGLSSIWIYLNIMYCCSTGKMKLCSLAASAILCLALIFLVVIFLFAFVFVWALLFKPKNFSDWF